MKLTKMRGVVKCLIPVEFYQWNRNQTVSCKIFTNEFDEECSKVSLKRNILTHSIWTHNVVSFFNLPIFGVRVPIRSLLNDRSLQKICFINLFIYLIVLSKTWVLIWTYRDCNSDSWLKSSLSVPFMPMVDSLLRWWKHSDKNSRKFFNIKWLKNWRRWRGRHTVQSLLNSCKRLLPMVYHKDHLTGPRLVACFATDSSGI